MSVYELTNTCTCPEYYIYCHACETSYVPDDDDIYGNVPDEAECPGCNSDNTDINTNHGGCGGLICFDDDAAILREELSHITGETGYILVGGANMGWRHMSGSKMVEEGELSCETLAINGDWTQRWTVESGKATCVQGTHDSMGEYYEMRPATLGEVVSYFSACHSECDYDTGSDVEVLDDDAVRCPDCGKKVTDIADLNLFDH